MNTTVYPGFSTGRHTFMDDSFGHCFIDHLAHSGKLFLRLFRFTSFNMTIELFEFVFQLCFYRPVTQVAFGVSPDVFKD